MADGNEPLFRASGRKQWFSATSGDLSLATRIGLDTYVNSTGFLGVSVLLVGRLIEELDDQNLGR